MSAKKESAKHARSLYLSEYQGILCTHSIDVEGYPFGSVVPYATDKSGQPIILISSIAQHTKNILVNNKVSLISTERGLDDIQTGGRLTYIGNARRIEDDEDTFNRYYNFFPEHKNYHDTHDFEFYTIDLIRARYIGGFGKIFWVSKEIFLKPNPFTFEQEQSMVSHMNADHLDAIRKYCQMFNIACSEKDEPVLASVDAEGFNIRIGARLHRIAFEQEVETGNDVRQAMVALSKQDKVA